MLTREELEAALAVGYETRGFELKGTGNRTDKAFMVKVVRAALGMGNLRDGGYVIVGINDGAPAALLPGLSDDDLASWLAYDDLADQLAVYSDPPLRFDVGEVSLSSGARVAVLQVHEFDEIPHLCARDYPETLRRGALYVRSRKKPETSEVASSVEMREVLDLATEKRLRAFVATAANAGLLTEAGGRASSENAEEYDAQRREAFE